jgi:hypothetical protein
MESESSAGFLKRQTRGRRVAILLLTCVGIAGASWYLLERFGSGAQIDVTQEELQRRVSERFPAKKCTLRIACLELSDVQVTLTEGSDRIGLSTHANASFGARQFPGRISVSGKLRYVPFAGDFYFDEMKIEELEASDLPEEYAQKLRVLVPVVVALALGNHPIFSIKANTSKEALAKLLLRDVKVVDGKLRLTFVGG